MREIIPLIDLFAGPGGMGEGFARFQAQGRARRSFKIVISIEKDPWAHRTLELRSFYRQFLCRAVPDEYYAYLRGEITRETLFAAWPKEARIAQSESRLAELGSNADPSIYKWIEQALKDRSAPHWVLIGGPPCQAYSVIGRSRMRALPEFEEDRRHFLYREYLQIIARFRPSIFVMENVKGLLSSSINGEMIFQRILKDLKKPLMALQEEGDDFATITGADERLEYRIHSLVVPAENPETLRPTDFVIRSEEYGIPQTRHRVILIGIRHDLGVQPQPLARHEAMITACRVLDDLPALRSCLTKRFSVQKDSEENWRKTIQEILNRDWLLNLEGNRQNLFTGQLRRSIETAVENLQTRLTAGNEFIQAEVKSSYRPDWYHSPALGGVCNHTTRSHMGEDLHRYLFAACYAQVYGPSPKMRDFPSALLPEHKNILQARKAGEDEDFDDRFRVQVADRPATTVTAHISKDGHYHIHYDPTQCRSLTVREAARLQTFPDDYFFEGPRTHQYRQVGNAVPPLLAYQIAGVVHEIFEQIDVPKP